MELCILFLHHGDNELSRFHANRFNKLNPRAALVPLTFNTGIPGAIRPIAARVEAEEWRNVDRLIYQWFQSLNAVAAERYLIVEYDTLCTIPVREFYREVWDAPLAAATIQTPEANPDWWWFRNISDPGRYNGNLAGLIPLSGVLMSRAVLAAIAPLASGPLYDSMNCECRVGTLAKTVGFTAKKIRPNASDYISSNPRFPTGPGIWHSVKAKMESTEEQ